MGEAGSLQYNEDDVWPMEYGWEVHGKRKATSKIRGGLQRVPWSMAGVWGRTGRRDTRERRAPDRLHCEEGVQAKPCTPEPLLAEITVHSWVPTLAPYQMLGAFACRCAKGSANAARLNSAPGNRR